jgi:hypothetical protein
MTSRERSSFAPFTLSFSQARSPRSLRYRKRPGDLAGFFSLIDPQSVLELVEIAETRITDEEVQALHQVIAVLCDCIQRTTADPASIELTRHARMVVGATTR